MPSTGAPAQSRSRSPSQPGPPPRSRPRVILEEPQPPITSTGEAVPTGLSFDDCACAPANGQNGYRYWENPLTLLGVHFRVRPQNYPEPFVNAAMGQLVYVGSPSASFVNTRRYEPGRLVSELNGNIYRVETRDAVSVFAHISNIRLRTANQAKPFEIPQAQDAYNPAETQEITCECCDLSTVYDVSGVVLFKKFLVIRDNTNHDHWINLTVGSDWTKIDLCFASASRRSNLYRSIRIVD
ncbi:hypothetical protein AAVH_37554, partial [Aphelenchoides avenae]